MGFLIDNCRVLSYTDELLKQSRPFSCGDKDLDNFFFHDAYNNEATLNFYKANGFKTIFSSETQEKEYVGLPLDKELKTRLLYFDLILLK